MKDVEDADRQIRGTGVYVLSPRLLRELRSLVDRKRHHCYATELCGRKVKTVAELSSCVLSSGRKGERGEKGSEG